MSLLDRIHLHHLSFSDFFLWGIPRALFPFGASSQELETHPHPPDRPAHQKHTRWGPSSVDRKVGKSFTFSPFETRTARVLNLDDLLALPPAPSTS